MALGCKGETQALEILYRRHAAFAIHLAERGIEGSARDVEDIAGDGFLRAFERLNDLTDRGAFRSWLGAIVVHAVRSRMRRGRLMSVLGLGKSSEPVDLDAIASSDASPHVRAQIAQIYALLRTLPTDERIAWTLRAVEGHDLETVARLTRCSLATVKRRITRTQRFLDEHFVDARAEERMAGDAPVDSSVGHAPDHMRRKSRHEPPLPFPRSRPRTCATTPTRRGSLGSGGGSSTISPASRRPASARRASSTSPSPRPSRPSAVVCSSARSPSTIAPPPQSRRPRATACGLDVLAAGSEARTFSLPGGGQLVLQPGSMRAGSSARATAHSPQALAGRRVHRARRARSAARASRSRPATRASTPRRAACSA